MGILQHPGDGNLCKQEMALITKLLEVFNGFQLRLVPVAGLIELPGIVNCEAGVLLRRLPSMVASCEDTARERIVGNHADALIGGQGKQFGLDVAEENIVARLHAIEAHDVQCVTRPQRFTEQPGGIVGTADIEDLATAHEIVQSAQRLLKGGVRVGDVHLIEVDVVGLQAAQTALNGAHDVLARAALAIGTAAHRKAKLRRQNNLLAPSFEPAANIFLGSSNRLRGRAERIRIGGIKEENAIVEGLIHNSA